MKKRLSAAVALILAALMLTGCASNTVASEVNRAPMADAKYQNYSGGAADGADIIVTDSAADIAPGEYEEVQTEGGGFVGASSSSKPASMSEKIIYSANASIETIDFDGSVETVYEMVEKYGGFLERSYVTGVDYSTEFYGSQTYRRAEFVIRVPSENFTGFKGELNRIGNVTNVSSDARNITTQYYDVQARLTAYRAQEKTLLSMLEKATSVSEMIEIENALSDVRYNIESNETILRNWDIQVDYSTVTIEVREVAELTRQVPVQRNYWQQIYDGFVASLESIGGFFKNLFKWFVSNLPVLAVLGACLVSIILILKKKVFRNKEKIDGKKAARVSKRMKKYDKIDEDTSDEKENQDK